jgi:hypothetical protein
VVASLAALTPSVVHATMTATFDRTRSLARSGSRSSFPSAIRISRLKFCPSDPAVFAHPLTKHGEVRLGLFNKKGTKETDLVHLPLVLRYSLERRRERTG